MNTKHTPGPWWACCLETEAHYVFGPAGDETICEPKHNDPSESNYDSASGTVIREERCANARLIAAAPCLLTHLARVISQFDALENNLSEADLLVIDGAKAAIAKATGKELA